MSSGALARSGSPGRLQFLLTGKQSLATPAADAASARQGTVDVRHEQGAESAPLGAASSVVLPPDVRSAGRARAFVGSFSAGAGLSGDLRRTASLLVSELVTNAIVHGRTGAFVEVELREGPVLRVSVSDDSTALLPEVDRRPDGSAEGGRGLLIVSLLAARWGVLPNDDGGKAVWFELDV